MQINLVNNSKTITYVNGKEKITFLGDLAIRQGGSFTLPFLYFGDYSTWLPRSEIRDNSLPASGNLLATFTFLPLTYSVEENNTLITLVLKANITAALIPTLYQGREGTTLSVNNCYVYDLELVDPNDSNNVLKLVDLSYIQVMPEVTE